MTTGQHDDGKNIFWLFCSTALIGNTAPVPYLQAQVCTLGASFPSYINWGSENPPHSLWGKFKKQYGNHIGQKLFLCMLPQSVPKK